MKHIINILFLLNLIAFYPAVSQERNCRINTISPSSLSFNANGGTKELSISYSNSDNDCYCHLANFTNVPSWATITQPYRYVVRVTVSKNTGNYSRTELIDMHCDNLNTSYGFFIKQAGVPLLNPGSINGAKTINYNTDAGTLGNSASASGGTGNYSYIWQKSPDNSSWSNILGATGPTYAPGKLTVTAFYRRKVTSGSQIKYTNTVRINVNASLLHPGSINGAKTIDYNTDAGTLGNSASASGGTGNYSYIWQKSPNNSSWSNIPGVTGLTYAPGKLTVTTFYRRKVTSGSQIKYTNTVRINVNASLLHPGSINGAKTIDYNTDAGTLGNSASASGGTGNYSYIWQKSPDNSSWINISGATGPTYAPGKLTVTAFYRRKVTSGSQIKYTNTVRINVNASLLHPGSINGAKTINYNTDAGTLGNSASASGGTGNYSYIWQKSPDNSSWINISGATGPTYAPGKLTVTAFYRRKVTSGSQVKYTNTVRINVNASLLHPGSINGAKTIDYNTDAGTLGNSASASGGTGNYSYIWQKSPNNSSWSNIPGVTGLTYAPGKLTVTTFYRRKVTSGSQIKYSNTIEITVNPTNDQNYIYIREPLIAMQTLDKNGKDYPATLTLSSPVTAVQTRIATSSIILKPGFHAKGSNGAFVAKIDKTGKNNRLLRNITYYDGLGRPMQHNAIGQSPGGKDLITHIEYDAYGRQAKEYLPYAHSEHGDGQYVPTARDETFAYYNTPLGDSKAVPADAYPYAEKIFEASPLNRIRKQGAPGQVWQPKPIGQDDHTIVFDYQTNTDKEVIRFDVGGTDATPTLVKNGYYAAAQLYKTVTYDENHNGTAKDHSIEEFTDKEGRIVLKRTHENDNPHDTYYVYDSYNNLTFIIPPKVTATDGVSSTELSELCYQYHYDHRNRQIEKKLPGKDWEYIVYDKQNRVVLTQDPNLRAKNQWLFSKYDKYGRVIYTGIYSSSAARATIQSGVNAKGSNNEKRGTGTIGGIAISYTNNAFPTTNTDLLTVNYYDNYAFADNDKPATPATVEGQIVRTATKDTRGLATATQVRTLNTNTWTKTYTYYDYRGRPIRMYSKNHLGGYTQVDSKLDFRGKPKYTVIRHKRSPADTELVTTDRFTYDHAERLLTHTQQINNQAEELIANHDYDEIGQLHQKRIGGNANGNGLQTIDYQYNIRGWMTHINKPDNLGGDLFAMTLDYNTGANPQYNGNISAWNWKTANIDNNLKTYDYTYDALNRIKSADYTASDNRNFDVDGITYDKNGNIKTFRRYGFLGSNSYGIMDNLSYTYNAGNELLKVEDPVTLSENIHVFEFKNKSNQTDEYRYDANGSMIADANKGITSVSYNHLNLPTVVELGSNKKIEWTYDAAGTKLQKSVYENGRLLYSKEYLGSFEYADGVLEAMYMSEGRIVPDGSSYKYEYTLKDHLGNSRVFFDNFNGVARIIQEASYYPFGLKHSGLAVTQIGVENKYTFQGQELQDDFGINWYGFKWRNADAALGRFFSIDPLAEKYSYQSPYNFSENRVIDGVELEGLEWIGYTAIMIDDFNQRTGNTGGFSGKDYMVGAGEKMLSSASIVLGFTPLDVPIDIGEGIHSGIKGDWPGVGLSALSVVGLDIIKDSKKILKTTNEIKTVDRASKKAKTYQTYTKTHPKTGKVYSGRTSGKGRPEDNVRKRDINHHMNKEGYGRAKLDKSSTNKDAIRGREQQNIETHGGAQSQGGASGNKINSVSPNNPNKQKYLDESKKLRR